MDRDWNAIVKANLQAVRESAPLVHNITNFVVMNSSANILLAQGAQPVMAHAVNEVEDMIKIASALVINIGTLTDEWVRAMILAGKTANEIGVPVVFDPVGAGATKLRSEKTEEILTEVKPSVIRGNASEINAIAGFEGARGVDSVHDVDGIGEFAKALAKSHDCVVGVSGERDLITDGELTIRVANGVPLMTRVTGVGCGLSATVGAFIGVNENVFDATVSAFGFYALAGDLAFTMAKLPGSFMPAFIDALHYLDENHLDALKINHE
ncbi:MAG TPA: hydroxyethylthiazole kinase [candidate division Zixibacteria bacterium]|nr:hydroxyethylthiazole kinase [candidate division Zixibacteria bacterium]